jgi:hypothetical protein
MADGSVTQIPEGKLTDYHCIHPDITPAAGPRVIDGCNLFVTADYLYWTARESNLQYASTGYSNSGTYSIQGGRTKTPHFDFESGFKTTLGWSFGHDCWDTLATYTWFQTSNNTGSIKATQDEGLYPYFWPYIPMYSDDYFTKAHTNWGLHFNAIDWELGRNCYISKYLSLRPFVGLKGTWQHQHFNNSYKGFSDYIPFSYHNDNYLSSIGLGIRTGLNTAWHLSQSWSIFGDLALSALWQSVKVSRKDSYTISGEDKLTTVNTRSNMHIIVPVLELALGIRKDVWINDDKVHIGIQAGWEEQIWWNQNQFIEDLATSFNGNLFLQGLTARLRIDF